MRPIEEQYLDLLSHLTYHGERRSNRTGIDTLAEFGWQIKGDISSSFPLLTTKKVHFKSVAEELFWMLRGESNVKSLQEKGVTIWDEWAKPNGELGPIYGVQWRKSPVWYLFDDGYPFGETSYIDQIKEAIKLIIHQPDSRRILVSAWNPADLEDMALQPCHVLFQFNCRPSGQLDCHMYQRSADVFLGVPFNIAQYALLTYMMAAVTGRTPGTLTISYGDVHLYVNHIEQAKEQLTRDARLAPKLVVPEPACVSEAMALWWLVNTPFEDLKLEGYDPWPAIKAPVAV